MFCSLIPVRRQVYLESETTIDTIISGILYYHSIQTNRAILTITAPSKIATEIPQRAVLPAASRGPPSAPGVSLTEVPEEKARHRPAIR